MLYTVNFEAVALERAALREALLAQIALVGSNTGVRSRVPLQVECVIEALAAERAEISLDVAVALHVSVQQSLETEVFAADAAREPVGIVILQTNESNVDFIEFAAAAAKIRYNSYDLRALKHTAL